MKPTLLRMVREQGDVAPVERPGRGLKLVLCEVVVDPFRSPRSKGRGAD